MEQKVKVLMQLMHPNDIYPKISRKTTIWKYTVIAIAEILHPHQKYQSQISVTFPNHFAKKQ